jgi:hypothetical protein
MYCDYTEKIIKRYKIRNNYVTKWQYLNDPAMVNRCLLRLMLHLLQSTILLNDELFGRRQVILD